MERGGLCITTFNSEQYFNTLWESVPFHKLDELVVVNGGLPYTKIYDSDKCNVTWIQHPENYGPAKSRNDGLQHLLDSDCDHFFLFEDDVICKSENIFDAYIRASEITGLEYFCFASYAWNSGPIGNRTPRLQVQYSEDLSINFFRNTCNEVTYRTRALLEKTGLYDLDFKELFDIEQIYRMTLQDTVSPMWYFADIANSDDLIMNNPDTKSRLDDNGSRLQRLGQYYELFRQKHGMNIPEIPDIPQSMVVDKLKKIKSNKLVL